MIQIFKFEESVWFFWHTFFVSRVGQVGIVTRFPAKGVELHGRMTTTVHPY